MKKKWIFGVTAGAILATSGIFLTSCGSSISLEDVVVKMGEVVTSISSDTSEFTTKTLEKNGQNFSFIAPNYGSSLNTLVLSSAKYGASTEIGQLGLLYDFVFGYSFEVLNSSYEIFKDAGTGVKTDGKKAEALSALDSALDAFSSRINQQKRDSKHLREYLESLGNYGNEIALNAIYNYKKEYQAFIRSGLDLAVSANYAVNVVYENLGFGESLARKLAGEKLLSFEGRMIPKDSEVEVINIRDRYSDIRYIDENGYVWRSESLLNKYLETDKESGKTTIKVKMQASKCDGKVFAAGKEVNIVEERTNSYDVQIVDGDYVFEKFVDLDSVNIEGDVASIKNKETFNIVGKLFKAGSNATITKINGEKISFQAVSNNDTWSATSTADKLTGEMKVNETVTLKENTLFPVHVGRKFSAGSEVSVVGSDVMFAHLSEGAVMWYGRIGESELQAQAKKSFADTLNLNIINDYYSILVESLDSKFVTEKEISNADFPAFFVTYYQDFNEALTNMIVAKSEKKYDGKLSAEEMDNLIKKHSIFAETEIERLKNLRSFNMHDLRFNKDFDVAKLSLVDAANLMRIMNFYGMNLKNWIDYYNSLFA